MFNKYTAETKKNKFFIGGGIILSVLTFALGVFASYKLAELTSWLK